MVFIYKLFNVDHIFLINFIFDQIHQVVLPLGIAAPVALARLGLGAAAQVLLTNPEIKDKVFQAATNSVFLLLQFMRPYL